MANNTGFLANFVLVDRAMQSTFEISIIVKLIIQFVLIDEEIIRLNNKIFDQNIEISGLINVAQRVLNYSQGKNSVIIKRSKGLKGLNITFKFRK